MPKYRILIQREMRDGTYRKVKTLTGIAPSWLEALRRSANVRGANGAQIQPEQRINYRQAETPYFPNIQVSLNGTTGVFEFIAKVRRAFVNGLVDEYAIAEYMAAIGHRESGLQKAQMDFKKVLTETHKWIEVKR